MMRLDFKNPQLSNKFNSVNLTTGTKQIDMRAAVRTSTFITGQ